jgi:carboxypeptidase-like protein/TonB-dependent receptor-like protein
MMLVALIVSATAFTQNIIKGKIIDKSTKEPVEYAMVVVQPGHKNIATDKFGNFRLSVSGDTANIEISYVGFIAQQITVKNFLKPLVVELERGSVDLKDVVITAHSSNNSFHTISGLDLNLRRPVNTSQDLMRLVPGLFIAQHMGGGKAEQIFFRGFDCDHGTDINVSVDGMPVNMVSHAHGQGYADLHFLIPETVESYDFGKGPYYSGYGDFTTAGYLSFNTKDALDKSTISLEGGMQNHWRALAVLNLLSDKAKQKGENLYIAGEYNYLDGPFLFAEHYKRYNLFGKYTTQLGANNKLSISASTFNTTWRASGEIPERAVANGTTAIDDNGNSYIVASPSTLIDRFATIDSGQGGNTNRTNIIAKLTTSLSNNMALENEVYYTRYYFQLHLNSTFYADDSVNGDELLQQESRDMFGYNGKLSKINYLKNTTLTSAVGLGARIDRTYGTEFANITEQYQPLDTINYGNIAENNINSYIDETLATGKWLFNVGSRLDYLNFNYQNSTRSNLIASPKVNIQYTVNSKIQFYLKSGKGFHSNDTRAVIGNNGLETLPAAYGADLGTNWKPIPHLYINAALWYLYLQQEFVLTDDGTIEPGGKTRREGIDLSARYQFNNWLFANLNVNLANPRLVDSAKGNNYLALAPTFTSTGGLDVKFKNGINGGISYRYMHNRAGNENYTLTADGYFIADLTLNYTRKKYEIGISVENLFNTKWNEFEAEEVTRMKGEPAAVDQMSFTPGTPFFAKLRLAVFF